MAGNTPIRTTTGASRTTTRTARPPTSPKATAGSLAASVAMTSWMAATGAITRKRLMVIPGRPTGL